MEGDELWLDPPRVPGRTRTEGGVSSTEEGPRKPRMGHGPWEFYGNVEHKTRTGVLGRPSTYRRSRSDRLSRLKDPGVRNRPTTGEFQRDCWNPCTA